MCNVLGALLVNFWKRTLLAEATGILDSLLDRILDSLLDRILDSLLDRILDSLLDRILDRTMDMLKQINIYIWVNVWDLREFVCPNNLGHLSMLNWIHLSKFAGTVILVKKVFVEKDCHVRCLETFHTMDCVCIKCSKQNS